MKRTKLVALIVAIVVVVLGASAGVMYAFGAFSSDKREAFELLKQLPQKINHSATGDYIGASDMIDAMLDQGMDVSVKCSNVQMDGMEKSMLIPESITSALSKLEFSFGAQLDFDNQKVLLDVGAEANDTNLSLQGYASLADQKIALAAPELINGKVFTLTGSGVDEQSQKAQEVIKHLTELKDSFKEYIDKQGESIYNGISCETIENGYRLTIPKDVTDSTINSLSEYVKENKDGVESLEEILGAEKGTFAETLDETLPRLTSETADFSFEVYGNQGKLTGLKTGMKDESGNELLTCNLKFTENGNQSSTVFTADMKDSSGQLAGKMEISVEGTDGDTCEDKITYKVNINDRVTMENSYTIAINKSTNELIVSGGSNQNNVIKTEFSGKGSVKNLTKGKRVTYHLDQFEMTEEYRSQTLLKMSAALEVTEGVHDGEITAPQGEEVAIDRELIDTFENKYFQELSLSLATIMTKWGINLNDLNDLTNADSGETYDYDYDDSLLDEYDESLLDEYDDSLLDEFDFSDYDAYDDEEKEDEEALIS